MCYVAQATRLRTCCAVGQTQIAIHHLRLCGIIELVVLRQVGLHDTQPDAPDVTGWMRPQSRRPLCGQGPTHHQPQHEWTVRVSCVWLVVGEHSWSCTNRKAQKREDPDADQ